MHGNARVDRRAILVAVRKMRECVGFENNKRTQRAVCMSVVAVAKEGLQHIADVGLAFLLRIQTGILCNNAATQVVSTAKQIVQN